MRFAIAQEREAGSLLTYACEKDHLPAEHGNLEFRIDDGECVRPHPDPRIQKMAECFLVARKAKAGNTSPDERENEPL